jgi:hypothetical protein
MSNGTSGFLSFPTSFASFPDLDEAGPGPSRNADRSSTGRDKKRHRRKDQRGDRSEPEDESRRTSKERTVKGSHKTKSTDRREDRHRHHDKGSEKNRGHRSNDPLDEADAFIQQAIKGNEIPKQDDAKKPPEASASAGSKGLFIEDRRGDDGNIRYGSLHAYAVPKYRRTGCKNVSPSSLATTHSSYSFLV